MSSNVTAINTKKPVAKRAPRKKAAVKAKPIAVVTNERNRARATWILGFVVPLMSLALSNMFGEFWIKGNFYIAGVAGLGVLTILSVSMRHLVASITDISGTPKKLSWALAVAFDSGIVLSEVALTFVADMSILTKIVCVLVLLGATLISSLLNVWAFQLERKEKRAK